MFIKIEKLSAGWSSKTTFNEGELKDIDIEHYERNNVEIIVYGHPYHRFYTKWLNAKDIMNLYEEKKDLFIEDVDGYYGIILLDKKNMLCEVFIDPYKIYTFYYYKEKNKIIISNKIIKITDELPKCEYNTLSIIEVIHFGFVLGDKTVVQSVDKFPAGARILINGNIEIEKSMYFDYTRSHMNYTKQEWHSAFKEHINKGLKLGGKVSLPLTGGLDSRTVLSALLFNKDKIHCYTHGLNNSPDVKLAKEISKKVNVDHSHYNDLDESFISRLPIISQELSSEFEGMVEGISFAHLPNSFQKESEIGDLFLLGTGGAMLKQQYTKIKKGQSNMEVVCNDIKDKLSSFRTIDVWKEKDKKEIDKLLLNSIEQEVNKLGNSFDAGYVDQMFYLLQRIGNFASFTIRYIGKMFKVFDPYLSKDLLKITLHTNAEDRATKQFHRFAINQSYQLSKIPTNQGLYLNKTGFNLRSKINLYNRYAKLIINRLLKRQLFSIGFTNYPHWFYNKHLNYIHSIVDYHKLEMRDIIKKEEYENILNGFANGKTMEFKYVARVMSIELFLNEINLKKGS